MSRAPRFLVSVLAAMAGLGGCANPADKPAAADLVARFYLENAQGQGTPVRLPRSQVGLLVNPKPVLTEGDIANVELVQVDLGRCLMFQLAPAASRDFYRLSVSNQGRRLVLFINGTAVGARRVDGPIANGVLFVFVELPDDELPELVARLKRAAEAWQRELKRTGE